MRQAPLRTIGRAAVFGLSVLLCASCGTAVREGRASSYLVIDHMSAASGADPGKFSDTLASDVITNVKGAGGVMVPTIFEDPATVTFHVALKDPLNPAGASTTNDITITSYHVSYTRADGRNTPGVDVPWPFDGSATATVKSGAIASLGFTLVRAQAKLDPPLVALRGAGAQIFISTIAQVTFYGHDQAGNQVSVTGSISVDFSDWGDPNAGS